MKTSLAAACLVATLVFASSTTAQTVGSSYRVRPAVYSPPTWMRHASTYQEGFLRGWADFGRALGEYNYNSSLAVINRQEAIRRNLENRLTATETFFEMREVNRQKRFLDQADRPRKEDYVRYAEQRLPDRLEPHEYHRALGALVWPAVLTQDEYALERQALDRAVASRTIANSGTGSETHRTIAAFCQRLEARLKNQIDEISTSDSIAARKFLASLKYEAQLPLGAESESIALR